ncbi:MAG: shikimate 5-dehydrogenase [Austwickia sp.]|nr:shikimate 5-dehydrogenase [Austwickia sp.]MCO5307875.1 shikimate 5-dehydrogenase [Austwickia sp.]
MTGSSRADTISKDTALCMSLSGRPGNAGTRFHNFLYDELGLDFVYKAFTTTDITAAVAGIRALGIRGCAISMPWKEDVIPLVDELDASAAAIESVNTIVNDAGRLRAYNTDYSALRLLLRSHDVPTDLAVAVLGSGGMAKAAVAAVRDEGFAAVTVVARNPATGPALADKYGAAYAATMGDLRPGLILNASPVGMSGGPDAAAMPVPSEAVAAAEVVFDVIHLPSETPLIRHARELGRRVIHGGEVAALQAAEQFTLYTGVALTDDQITRARAFSQGG